VSNNKYKLGDRVRFNSQRLKGVGVVVAISQFAPDCYVVQGPPRAGGRGLRIGLHEKEMKYDTIDYMKYMRRKREE